MPPSLPLPPCFQGKIKTFCHPILLKIRFKITVIPSLPKKGKVKIIVLQLTLSPGQVSYFLLRLTSIKICGGITKYHTEKVTFISFLQLRKKSSAFKVPFK